MMTKLVHCLQGEVFRVIRHFHFTTWPDFGVPDPPQTLVRFVRFFRETVGADQRPIVVHCRLVGYDFVCIWLYVLIQVQICVYFLLYNRLNI